MVSMVEAEIINNDAKLVNTLVVTTVKVKLKLIEIIIGGFVLVVIKRTR